MFSARTVAGGDGVEVVTFSRVTQQLQMRPPLHKSSGLPPSMMQDMLRLQSKTLPLYQHVCGITTNMKMKKLILVLELDLIDEKLIRIIHFPPPTPPLLTEEKP